MNYFELYYAYLSQCELENWANMRDPNHDFMEWNHTLPQCIFGDQPIGQWLTIEQHAIASALQTLAFRESCLCPWHKQHLPPLLCELSWTFFSVQRTKENKQRAAEGKHPWQDPERIARRIQQQIENGTHPFQGIRGSQQATERNLRLVREGRHPLQNEKIKREYSEREREKVKNGVHPFQKFKGTKYWVNKDGQIKRQIEKPEGEWQNARKWKEVK
jgi:hypothetical protein